jgi:hypothetical protein
MNALMSSRAWRWTAGLAVVGATALALLVGVRSGPAPHAATAVGAAAKPAAENPIPATPLWGSILHHTQVAQGLGPGAGSRYAASLARLQPQAEAVTAAIVERFERLPPELHGLQHSLAFLLVELGHPHGEALLARLVAVKDPPSTEPPSHHMMMTPTQRLRLIAIDGLYKLATAGSAGARRGLFSALDHPDRSTRLAAARTLFHGFPTDAEIQATLRARVRPDERFTINGHEKPSGRPGG